MNRWLHLLVALIFLSFAIVQFNDPDSVLWIVLYASVLPLCIAAFQNKKIKTYNQIINLVLLFILGFLSPKFFIWLFNSAGGFMDTEQEVLREYMGVGLSLVTSLLYYFKLNK